MSDLTLYQAKRMAAGMPLDIECAAYMGDTWTKKTHQYCGNCGDGKYSPGQERCLACDNPINWRPRGLRAYSLRNGPALRLAIAMGAEVRCSDNADGAVPEVCVWVPDTELTKSAGLQKVEHVPRRKLWTNGDEPDDVPLAIARMAACLRVLDVEKGDLLCNLGDT